MLTFETAAVQGVTGIIEKLTVYHGECFSLFFADIVQESTVRKSRTQGLHSRCATFQRDWRNNSHGHRGAAGMQDYNTTAKLAN